MNYPTVLVNYRIPVSLKRDFEDACRRLNMPMTAQINLLIRQFVREQKREQQQPTDSFEPLNFYSTKEINT